MTVASLLEAAGKKLTAGRRDEAAQIYETILAQRPTDLATLVAKARLQESRLDFATAVDCYEKALTVVPADPASLQLRVQLRAKLGDCYQRLKRPEPAIKAFQQCLAEAPSHQEAYMPCILLLERRDRREEARELLAAGLRVLPDDPELQYLRGRLAGDDDEAARAYARARELGLPERSKHIILGEMAVFEERRKNYDAAMKLCQAAQDQAAIRAQAAGESPERSLRLIEASRRWLTAETLAAWAPVELEGDSTQDPAFIVGFPRSGTTLLEQIVGAHPRLQVTDESLVFVSLVHGLPRILGAGCEYPAAVAGLAAEQLSQFRRAYRESLLNSLPELKPELRIVDKNPMTMIYLGAVHRFFPRSPVLMMIRDPRDVCLSCFFQTFAPNPDTVNFFSLEQTARYYARCMDLYLQTRDLLPMPLLEVRYEELVADFEPQARKIIDFIGEDWHPGVTEFYRHGSERFIHTPSYAAVRQPVTTAATGKWRRYEKHLQEVLPILQPYLDAFGYTA